LSFVSANGIKFHYWTVGEGPNIILLHGLGGNLAIWHLRIVTMLREYFTVHTYDLRGHGKTEVTPSGYTTKDMSNDLLALMDTLGIDKAHLVGHSLGADIALHFALDHPERAQKLILIEPGIPALVAGRKREEWIGWTYWANMIKKYAGHDVPPQHRSDWRYLLFWSAKTSIMFGPNRGNPRRQDEFINLLDTTTLVTDYEVVGDLTLENIATIEHPKLLIYDEESPYIDTFHAISATAKNCTPILLPPSELRHFFPLEQPEALVNYILDFVGVRVPAAVIETATETASEAAKAGRTSYD
jgi:pimeloyl-ACP methyl ester carboxylesterase